MEENKVNIEELMDIICRHSRQMSTTSVPHKYMKAIGTRKLESILRDYFENNGEMYFAPFREGA